MDLWVSDSDDVYKGMCTCVVGEGLRGAEGACVCANTRVSVICMCARVSVCLCVTERERERVSERVSE